MDGGGNKKIIIPAKFLCFPKKESNKKKITTK
jgi:hypothetical protein